MNDYQWYKAHHKCVRCHRNDATKGMVTCLDCREKEHEYDRQRKSKALANETPEHKVVRVLKMKERRERLKAQGICIACGKRRATHGAHCLECWLKQKRSNLESKRRRRAYDKSRGLSRVNSEGTPSRVRVGRSGGNWSWD